VKYRLVIYTIFTSFSTVESWLLYPNCQWRNCWSREI